MSDLTASADHLRQADHRAKMRQSAEVPSLAACTLWHGFCFCIGAALFVTAVGLWAFASADAAATIVKLGATIAFLGGSAVFVLMAIAPQDMYHLEFDANAQVFRVLERDETGGSYVLETHALGDMEKLRFDAGALRAWDAEGATLMAVPMQAHSAQRILKAVLANA